MLLSKTMSSLARLGRQCPSKATNRQCHIVTSISPYLSKVQSFSDPHRSNMKMVLFALYCPKAAFQGKLERGKIGESSMTVRHPAHREPSNTNLMT